MAAKAPARKPATSSKPVTLTAKLDQARQVILTGEFTKWSRTGVAMVKGADGLWRVSFSIPPGRYQYRLLVDGQWSDHAEAKERIPNPFGTENCLLIVP